MLQADSSKAVLPSIRGELPVLVAIELGTAPEILKLLIDHGSLVDWAGCERTPLMAVATSSSPIEDENHESPLDLPFPVRWPAGKLDVALGQASGLSEVQCLEYTRLLLEHGASATRLNLQGVSAADLAATRPDRQVLAAVLRQAEQTESRMCHLLIMRHAKNARAASGTSLDKMCGFVAPEYGWHQAKGPHGFLHRLRCRHCNARYEPWRKDGRLCKFNKVLLNQDPANETRFVATPAWWMELSAKLFANLFKEITLKIRSGSAEMNQVTYDNVTKVNSQKVYVSYGQPTIFEMVQVPTPAGKHIATLSVCKGYEHCDTSPQQIERFLSRDHMAEEEVFKDIETLYNDIASCFKMGDTRVLGPFHRHCRS